MNNSPTVAVQRYEIVRNEVRTKLPAMWNMVIKLCAEVPDQIDIADVWQFGRDKPCWSNIKVSIGEKIAADILRSEDFNSYQSIASDAWAILLLKRGSGWKKNENFELRGESVQNFIRGLTGVGLSSYIWKLYAIRNLAISLTRSDDVRGMVKDLSQRGRLESVELKDWTKKFAKSVGMGWGIVTVYHMLTDLGLTPKPDLHLKRSAIRMGLLSPQIPSNYPEELFNNVDEHDIVLAVMKLSELTSPTAYPENPRSTLREVDKVLMEWSRQELCRAL
jgi:hypothetical protein